MKVLMVEPGKSPYAAEIDSGLKSLQAAVGGDIQAVYPYEDPVALVCKEEGKLMGQMCIRDSPQCVFGPVELHSLAAQQNASCRFMKPVLRLSARLPAGSYRQMGGID